MPKKENPYGDDAGTRVGRPSNPDRKADTQKADKQADGDSQTGAGQEGARGIHGANKDGNKDGNKTRGSEPLQDRSEEHVSGYGGSGGSPKRSSDQR